MVDNSVLWEIVGDAVAFAAILKILHPQYIAIVVRTPPGIERSGFKPWPGSLRCVLGQDTLLSQCRVPANSQGNLTKMLAGGDYL